MRGCFRSAIESGSAVLAALLFALLSLAGCESAPSAAMTPLSLQGETMGTTYSIKLAKLPAGVELAEVQQKVDDRLAHVNRLMSNWDSDSEVSRFNSSDSTDWFSVSAETALVLHASQETSRATDGAFDVTVGPLIDLWGFGPAGRRTSPPSDAEIEALSDRIGYDKLEVRLDPPALKKQHPELSVNLSAVAKGYGVDAVGETLEELEITAYLVEIGGEVRTRGKKLDGSRWKIGVERPSSGSRGIEEVLALDDDTLATSGDYRNFYEQAGARFSHTIDPATRKSITHSLASVTVFSENTMLADARATAIMVLGPERGYDYAQSLDLPVLLIEHQGKGFRLTATPAWIAKFGEPK